MTTAVAGTLAHELAAIVGAAHVREDAEHLRSRAIDEVVPQLEVAPADEEQLAAVLRAANARRLAVAPAGAMTRQGIGAIPEGVDILLRTSRLSGIRSYDPGDLTVGVAAGTPFADLQQALKANGQFLPLEPVEAESTVGGLLATAYNDPLSAAFGTLRDYCIGVRFATPEGNVVKGGGEVVKNVAGYDLMKLMIGSFGTLGVITAANFKVFPRPRQFRTFICTFATLDDAGNFRRTLLRSQLAPLALELISPRAWEYMMDDSAPRDPDVHLPAGRITPPPTEWRLAIRAGGSDAVLTRYARELGSAGAEELNGEADARFWARHAEFGARVLRRHRNAMLLQLALPLRDVEPALLAAEHVGLDYNLLSAAVGRAATGVLLLALFPLAVDPPSAMHFANAASALRGALPRDSSAVVLRCPLEAKRHFDVWGTTPTDLSLMKQVKRALDPNNILNRGRFML